jgi:isopropylmalate/homocitrate/citramalate synthase
MVEAFDTTLRDGMQVEGVSATVEDKLRIAEQLDYLGVHFIEGGWPGANPKDIEFFARAAKDRRVVLQEKLTTMSPCATFWMPTPQRCASLLSHGITTSPMHCKQHLKKVLRWWQIQLTS